MITYLTPKPRAAPRSGSHRSPRANVVPIARAVCLLAVVALTGLALTGPVQAMPSAPGLVCETYPDSAWCEGSLPPCTLCHTAPPERNLHGAAIEAVLAPGASRPLDPAVFADLLPQALLAVEDDDPDGDGFSSLDEILAGSLPGDGSSVPAGDGAICELEEPVPYNVCERDVTYTYRKVMLDFCGRSATRQEIAGLQASDDRSRALHDTLDDCLDGEFWIGRDGVLWNLANRKIKPLQAVKAGEDAGSIPLADYYDDYNLFVYLQMDNRDVRELLTAQYFVDRIPGPPTRYVPYTRTAAEDVQARGFGVAQLVTPERRAGMLTSRWFLIRNTMFTPVPRTSAAQAYRAYLGLDIARLQGLEPVTGEPVDYDGKSVARDECAVCHSTLDPASYPFTRYEGLIADPALIGLSASYNPDRMTRFTAINGGRAADTPEAGVVLGQPVADLLEWAQVAANSDEMARATVMDYWKLLFAEEPRPEELDQFNTLWQAFQTEHGHGVERMLHDLIDTEAYSVP